MVKYFYFHTKQHIYKCVREEIEKENEREPERKIEEISRAKEIEIELKHFMMRQTAQPNKKYE